MACGRNSGIVVGVASDLDGAETLELEADDDVFVGEGAAHVEHGVGAWEVSTIKPSPPQHLAPLPRRSHPRRHRPRPLHPQRPPSRCVAARAALAQAHGRHPRPRSDSNVGRAREGAPGVVRRAGAAADPETAWWPRLLSNDRSTAPVCPPVAPNCRGTQGTRVASVRANVTPPRSRRQ
jgi:hypothetical protein